MFFGWGGTGNFCINLRKWYVVSFIVCNYICECNLVSYIIAEIDLVTQYFRIGNMPKFYDLKSKRFTVDEGTLHA